MRDQWEVWRDGGDGDPFGVGRYPSERRESRDDPREDRSEPDDDDEAEDLYEELGGEGRLES